MGIMVSNRQKPLHSYRYPSKVKTAVWDPHQAAAILIADSEAKLEAGTEPGGEEAHWGCWLLPSQPVGTR